MAKGLALNGCDVTVITAFPHYPHGNISEEYRWKPLKVEWIGKIKVIRTLVPPIKSEGFFKRLILMFSFAVSSLFAMPFVGAVDAIWASSWVPGWIYSRVKRTPLALNVDDMTLEDLIDLRLLCVDSIALKIALSVYKIFFVKGDVVTPISSGYLEIMVQKYCVNPSRIHLVRSGVDLSVFKPRTERGKSGKFMVLYSGGFSVAYNFSQVFKAAKIVEREDDNVEFVVQGKGEMLDSMRREIAELNVKNVRIVDKLLSREAVAELLGEADVLILPLVEFDKPYRGMSSKLYEYQAMAKPIICCSRGLPAVYVRETNSGIVICPEDHEGLAKAVLDLKENPILARKMGENGRKCVENEASIEAVGLRMKKIFETLTNCAA